MNRRGFGAGMLAALGAACMPPWARAGVRRAARPADAAAQAQRQLVLLEQRHGARLGVQVQDRDSGGAFSHRADERFPLCSTFKLLAAGAVLARADRGDDSLGRLIRYGAADIVAYSPVTGPRQAEGMTLEQLCEAAVTRSDNTAGNLLLSTLGGPPGLTAYARGLGDRVTRLDRIETALNEARPGDPRDTTTPAAMAGNLERLLLGDALQPASRQRLADWLLASRTGDTRLRAGLPPGWRIGDKTGAGGHGTNNDVGVIWPRDGAPVLITAYLTQSSASRETQNAVLAEVGRIAAHAVAAWRLGG